jgi:pimeloyl-ACP methyl ester carboxylesterase
MTWKKIASWTGCGVLGLVGLTIALIVAALGWRTLAQWRNANARAITAPAGIDDLRKVRIGGIDQWIHIRGENVANPILLYVHGGPGTPMMPFESHFQTPLERDFTVVEWDQRGAGKTYVSNGGDRIAPTLTFGRMKADAHELTAYLKTRFHRPKIFLIGHSWGSILGLPVALERPDDYYAFVGTGVVIDFREGEAAGYRHVLAEAQRRGDREAIAALEAIAPYPALGRGPRPAGGVNGARVLRDYLARYGYAMASVQVRDFKGLQRVWLGSAIDSPQYGPRDLASFVTADPHIYDRLYRYMDGYDVRALGMETTLPVVFVDGDQDWQTPWPIAKRYIGELQSPCKAFYLMPGAGHAGPADRPELFAEILRAKVRPLAFDLPLKGSGPC